MASLNRVILIGNCGKDPETRFTTGGDAVTNVSIACNETWKDKETGEKKEKVEWVNLVFFKKVAEIAGQYLKKGSQCGIEGRLQTRKWDDKQGVTHYSTEVVVDKLVLLGGKRDDEDGAERSERQSNARTSTKTESTTRTDSTGDGFDSDVPF